MATKKSSSIPKSTEVDREIFVQDLRTAIDVESKEACYVNFVGKPLAFQEKSASIHNIFGDGPWIWIGCVCVQAEGCPCKGPIVIWPGGGDGAEKPQPIPLARVSDKGERLFKFKVPINAELIVAEEGTTRALDLALQQNKRLEIDAIRSEEFSGPLTVQDHTRIVAAIMEYPLEILGCLGRHGRVGIPEPERVLRAALMVPQIDKYTKGAIDEVLDGLPALRQAELDMPEEMKNVLADISNSTDGMELEDQVKIFRSGKLLSKFEKNAGLSKEMLSSITLAMEFAADMLEDGKDTIYSMDHPFYQMLPETDPDWVKKENDGKGPVKNVAQSNKGIVQDIDKGGAVAGAGTGAVIGLTAGSPTGPGAIVTGAAGAVVGGAIGAAAASTGAVIGAVISWLWD